MSLAKTLDLETMMFLDQQVLKILGWPETRFRLGLELLLMCCIESTI